MSIPILIAMVLYMAMVIGIGFICSKKNQNSEDYFLGGRGLGPWVTAMSAEASDMSSWLLMGLPGLAFATGFSQAGWTAIGLILGTYLNWKIIAKRLRHYTEVSENSITVPDFFSNRFKDDKKILSSISAIMILIFLRFIRHPDLQPAEHCLIQFWIELSGKYDCMCGGYCYLYIFGRISGSKYNRSDSGTFNVFAIVVVLIVGIVAAGGVGSVIEYGRGLEGFLIL